MCMYVLFVCACLDALCVLSFQSLNQWQLTFNALTNRCYNINRLESAVKREQGLCFRWTA